MQILRICTPVHGNHQQGTFFGSKSKKRGRYVLREEKQERRKGNLETGAGIRTLWYKQAVATVQQHASPSHLALDGVNDGDVRELGAISVRVHVHL